MYVTLLLAYLKRKVNKFQGTIFKNSNQVKELVCHHYLQISDMTPFLTDHVKWPRTMQSKTGLGPRGVLPLGSVSRVILQPWTTVPSASAASAL